ncbi:unnamed protein product, partial [Rotaria sordida]
NLYNNPIYNQFYNYLIEQLDFTKINREGLSNTLFKQYYDLLWRILGYLPPSNEFLENMNTYNETTYLLHLFRLEKKIINDKYIKEFLSKEITFTNIEWFKNLNKKSYSLFDLIVYQMLLQNLTSTSEEINNLYKIFLDEFKLSLNTNPYIESLLLIPIIKNFEDKTKTITIPILPNDFEELFKYQLNYILEQENNLNYIFLRQILQILSIINPEINDKQLYIEIQLNTNLQFLKEQIKLKDLNIETIQNDINECIYKNIFEILFNKNFPNDIINEDIYHDLIKYLDEQFQPNIFQNCLLPHNLFDLLYLTSKPNLSLSIFARMLMLFNKIFSYSNQFQLLIQDLNYIANLTNEQLSQWLSKLVLLQNNEKNQLYTAEQYKHILETFTKYLIKKNDDGTNMIGEEVSLSILSLLIQLGNELLKPNKYALGFPQIIQLLIILAGHGSGNGHTFLFQAAAIWLEFCADTLADKNEDSTPSSFLSSLLSSLSTSSSIESLTLFHYNILEASVYLLAYINDILIALKHLSTINDSTSLKSPLKLDESGDDEDDDSQDDEDINIDQKKTLLSSTIQFEYDPNKLCTYTTTKKEYANQHWYHCHTCKMIDRVGICQICANVCHKDHDISYAKYGSFFCDCGAKEDGSCQALAKRPITTTTIIQPISSLQKRKIKKLPSLSNKKPKLTNRQRRLIRQINTKQQDYNLCIQNKHIPYNTLRLFKLLQPYINNQYQQIYSIENKFDLISEYLKTHNQLLSIENDENKQQQQQQQQLFTGILHSQENAFEHVKLSYTNEHGQQIKQLLSTNSIRRQGMCIMSSLNPEQTKQHLIVSQEKGKQAMITILQLNSLLKQTTTMINNVINDNSTKKKLTLNKLNTFNIPFTILSMQPNQLNSDYLCITGLKDCHILNIDNNGRLREPTIILLPNLDSTGNYIIRAQWLSDKNQAQIALLTADFIKIYDLSIDTISPIYYFILPTGKVRDCTFYYTKRNNIEYCYILIMASNGYIYYEQLSESSSARNGSFYVTNTLDIKHETINETNNNGILLGGGVSVYFSSTLKLLFWSYVHGKNFYGIIDETNIEKLLMIRSIDVKMTPTTTTTTASTSTSTSTSSSSSPSSSTNGNNKSTSTYHTLCSWSEIPHHPGLIYTMTQMTNNPVVLMITPSNVGVSEIKMQMKTTKIQDIVAVRYEQRTTFILLADDGSLKILLAESDKTNYWLNKLYQKKKYFPMIDLDLNDEYFDYDNINCQYTLSDNETDDQQEPIIKRRKQTITTATTTTTTTSTVTSASTTTTTTGPINESINGLIKFPVDFFESCQLLTEYEFGGRDLLDVYNVAQLKLRLSTPGMFIANVRTGGFTLEVINKDPDNKVITGVRIHIGLYSMDKSPQYFELFGRTIQVNNLQGPRWYDLCLTREESIQGEKKFNIFIAQSIDPNHITVIDDVKVYGKTKEEFQWPDNIDGSLLTSTTNTGMTTTTIPTTTNAINEYLHSFRETNDEKELATLPLPDRLLVYSMQVLTGSLSLHHNLEEQNRSKLNSDIVQYTSHMFHMSLPPQIQRYSRRLLKEFFSSISSTDFDFYEHIDRLQLTFLSQCFSSINYLELFNDIQSYEYLLLSLLSITRRRPHNINRYLNIIQNESKDVISKSASMEIFIPYLINIFFNLLNQRPTNPLLESIDNKTINLKQIEKLLHILVDIYHSLALNEPQICMNLIVNSYIRLLTYHDYHINFIIKNALNRCMQPKIQRLISKLSTASDLNQQDTTDKQFHSLPLSAQIYTTEQQIRPRWINTPSTEPTTITTITNPIVADENAMLQYALALSMSENPDQIPPPPPPSIPSSTTTNIQQTIEYVDNDDETPSTIQNDIEINQMLELMVNTDNINEQSINIQNDHSDNNSLYEGDDGHVSESSSTTNEGGEQNTNDDNTTITTITTNNNNDNNITSTPIPSTLSPSSQPPLSSSSNDSNSTIKLNINESIDSNIYEQRLYDLKHLIVEKLLDNLDEYLLNNTQLNGLNSIAYLQLLLTLTIEFASKSDHDNQQFVHYILKSLLRQMIFLKDINQNNMNDLIKRTSQHEIQLMLLRLFTVYVSFMLKVRDNEREQYLHLSLTAAKQLDESNVVNYCLYALQIVYKYLLKQPIDENLLNEQMILSPSGTTTSTTNSQTSSISIMTLLKPVNQQSLPDLSPFFYKQYTKHHANDVFEAYPELLAEIATRLPYQMKKVIDYTSESRPFLLSSDWQKCLCEYYVLPQGSFLKRQIRKLLMYICGSRDKYRKLRDFHVLSTNITEIKNIYEEIFLLNNNEQRKTISTQIPYVTLMRLVDHLKSCQDISNQRCSNWQKFCKNDSTILHFLVQLIMLVDDSLVPFILHLLINSISSPSSSSSSSAATTAGSAPTSAATSSSTTTTTTTTSNRILKTSKSVRPNDFDSTDDISICSIALQFSKIISNKLLEDFIRLFLLENNQQSIRWLTHTFLYNLYINSNKQLQDYIFDLLINLWSTISYYGLKSFQYIDLLGYIIIKNKDDKRTNEFLPKLELMLKTQNQLLLNHPNASIYRRLSTIIDIEQNNGYYFETEPCLVCNNPDIPYQQVKLQAIKLDQRYTTQSHIVKLIQAYSIQKLHIKMSEIKRNKAVRTIRFYYNNRHVQSIVDLKNSVNCKWLLAKTIKLTNIQQTEVKIDFIIPIIACNLMIEYVDFFETPTSNLPTVTDTTTLQCPRCNSAVAATPGICPNCGENVFQCHKCRSINYDERDPFLCNSCGYCKYCKFDFIFTAKQINYVEPIESDEDRIKTIATISQLLEKTDKIYRQLLNQKPILEYLLTKLNSDDQTSTLIPPLPTTTTITNPTTTTTTTTTGDTSDQQQQQPPSVPTPTITLPSTNNPNGINRIVQQIAPKYNIECRQTYDELGKYIQKIICARKELNTYDQRHSNSLSTKIMITTPSRSHHCYGCILSTISHCILLLRAFVTSSNRLKQSITNNISLIDELLLNNIRYTNQQIRHDVRLLFCYLTRDNIQLTDYITTKILNKIEIIFEQKFILSSSSLINYDILVLFSLIQRSNQDDQDLCWENKLRCIFKLFLYSLKISTPQILELITLPCLKMLLQLSKSQQITTNINSTKLISIDIEKFLSKQITYQDWNNNLNDNNNNFSLTSTNKSWLEKLIFCSQSATIRYLTCKLIQTLCINDKQKLFIIQILMNYLHNICDENLLKYSYEYVQLIKDLLINDNQLKLILCNDEQFNIIKHIAKLIENEILIINKQDEKNLLNSNLTFGYSIKSLTELLNLFLQQDELKQKYKSILIAIVLNGYLTLKKLIIQRTKLIDEAQNKMLELLEQMTRGNEQETRQFMIICIDTIEKFQLDDMQTPLFIFERLCNLIYPEETMQENKEFFIVVEKDPNQEDFLQGRMMGNPYSSADPAMGPLMRDIKNKICTDCELIALLEDDNGMELLIANKIINLGLAVRDVYKKVWLPYINSHQTTPSNADPTASAQPIVNSSQNEYEPMHIVYRMRGLLGDATEDIIETFDTKKNANENGEDDPEDIYRLANVLSEHSGLETMLKRLDSIHDMSSGKALLQILLKLFEYAIKLKVNRQRLINPNLRSISSMLNKLNLLLKTETEEQGRDQGLLLLTEKLLFIMDQLFHEASTTLSQDKYNEFSVSCEGDIEQLRSLLNYIKLPFVKTHPSLMEALIHLLPYLSFGNKEKMRTLLDYFKSYLEFDRFDLEQTSSSTTTTISNDNDSQLHLDCFCEICKHLDKKSVYGKEFRDLVNESNGIIDQCINYIESNSPQVKTYLGMQDQDSWKEFLNKPSLSYVLRLLTGLSYGHEHIQMKIGQSLIPILHKIEQLTTAGKVGVLAEDLLHSLTENEQVAKKIDDVRNQTRAEKKRLAQEARDRKMRELNLTKITRNKSVSESSATASKTPVSHGDLTDETGHVCCICREGYKYFPNKVLAIYTFTKKVDIEPYEAKTRKTPGYATVTHFNIIHIECHTSAIKQARSRDEWESALLQNANTRCNGLLPLWGPDVAEAQFTTALARYDTNIIEATGIRETSPTLSIHDIKLLLLRFADVQSFSEDTGGGGRESNIRLIPYEMHTILYVLTTTRQIEREEKLLQNYLSRPDLLINEVFEVDGPFFLTTLSLIIMKPNDWEKNRRIFLQKLLLTTHIRSVNTSNDRTKIASKALKSFATYKTTLVFFGLVNAFFVHMLNPRFDMTSTLPYNQQLAQFLRCNDAFIMEACTKILKHFEQDLLPSQTFEALFNALDLSQLSEQWIQDAINILP